MRSSITIYLIMRGSTGRASSGSVSGNGERAMVRAGTRSIQGEASGRRDAKTGEGVRAGAPRRPGRDREPEVGLRV